MHETKKKTAAIIAVLHYLKTEEEAGGYLVATSGQPAESADNFWNFSGRQSQMMMRNMSQMRLFPGWIR